MLVDVCSRLVPRRRKRVFVPVVTTQLDTNSHISEPPVTMNLVGAWTSEFATTFHISVYVRFSSGSSGVHMSSSPCPIRETAALLEKMTRWCLAPFGGVQNKIGMTAVPDDEPGLLGSFVTCSGCLVMGRARDLVRWFVHRHASTEIQSGVARLRYDTSLIF